MLKQLSVFLVFSSFGFTFDVIHLCDIYTKNSILNNKENYRPLPVGNRKRYATCTGATWFHENYLAVLNLYGEKLTTYKFNKEENKFIFLQEISNKDGAQFEYPENLAISPD